MRIRGRTAAFIGVTAAMVLGVAATIAYSVGTGRDPSRTVTWWVPNWDTPIATELVEEFEAQNPDLSVEMVETTSDTMANKVSVAIGVSQLGTHHVTVRDGSRPVPTE